MAYEVITLIQNTLVGVSGNLWLWALGIIFLFLIIFLIIGIDFRFALALVIPAMMGFMYIGWIPLWVGIISGIVVITFSLYVFVNWVRDRS